MKKRIISSVLLVALALSLSLTATARWSYTSKCDPVLSFSGTTANCSLSIKADDKNSAITATLKLIRENTNGTETLSRTWSGLSGTGSLNFADTHGVAKGETYRLEVFATVVAFDGTEYPYTYARATCP